MLRRAMKPFQVSTMAIWADTYTCLHLSISLLIQNKSMMEMYVAVILLV